MHCNLNNNLNDILASTQNWAAIPSFIAVTSHKGHDISNPQKLDCLFHSLFMLTKKKTSKLHITGLLWQQIHQSLVDLPYKGPSNAESIST